MKKYLYPAFWLTLVVCVNLYFRAFPIYFPQLKSQANAMLDDAIRQGAIKEVMQKFPQYDPLAKERLVKEKIAEYKKQKKNEVIQQRDELYKKLKDRHQDDRGQTYLMELDCWHWSRYVKNVFYLGRPGDEVRGGRQYDTLMLAPTGMEISWDRFLFYFSSGLYRIFTFFKFVPIFDFTFYLPLFFAALFICVLFFFSFCHGRYFGAIISTLFIGLTPNFIPRSCAGWFDKDILNMLFPILVIWSYLLAYPVNQTKKRLFFLFLSAFWVGLFCFTWPYWWFVFMIIVFYEAASCGVMLFMRLQYKKDNLQLLKQHAFSLAAFTGFSVFWIIILCGLEPFSVLYRLLRDAIILSKPVAVSIWPNVYSTVGELKKSDFREVINSLGGGLIFFSSLLSLFIILIRNLFIRKDDGFKSQSIILLFIWFVSMLYACFKGVRFVVFLAVPLGISLGWMVNDIYQYFISRKMIRRARAGVSCLAFFLVLPFFINANKVSRGIYPLINDPWYKVLSMLQQSTPKDTVINSWWDFGDWFKVIAQRKVIFDGQSQNGPQAYWMAKALLASNEEESVAILRMLNNGGNKAFELIDSYLNDPLRSMLLLEGIIPLEYSKAKDRLSDFLPASAVNEVLMQLFEKPPDANFIVDYSMLYKIGAISYLGNWNFSKVYIVQNFHSKEKEQILDYLEKLGKDTGEMQRLYQEAFLIPSDELDSWISHPLQFYSQIANGVSKDGLIYFDNGFIFNPKEKSIYTSSGQIPRSLVYSKENGLVEVGFTNANLNFSVLVFEEGSRYKAVLLDRELCGSLFSRLYFFRGLGLKHFESLINAEEGQNYIGSYKIKW